MDNSRRGSLIYSEKELDAGKKILFRRKLSHIYWLGLSLLLLTYVVYEGIYQTSGVDLFIIISSLIAVIILIILYQYSLNKVTALEIYENGIIFPNYPLFELRNTMISWKNIHRIYINRNKEYPIITVVINNYKSKETYFYVYKKHIVNLSKFVELIKDKIKIVFDVDAIIVKGKIKEIL